jgi:Tfp pilus assembly protein PilN
VRVLPAAGGLVLGAALGTLGAAVWDAPLRARGSEARARLARLDAERRPLLAVAVQVERFASQRTSFDAQVRFIREEHSGQRCLADVAAVAIPLDEPRIDRLSVTARALAIAGRTGSEEAVTSLASALSRSCVVRAVRSGAATGPVDSENRQRFGLVAAIEAPLCFPAEASAPTGAGK